MTNFTRWLSVHARGYNTYSTYIKYIFNMANYELWSPLQYFPGSTARLELSTAILGKAERKTIMTSKVLGFCFGALHHVIEGWDAKQITNHSHSGSKEMPTVSELGWRTTGDRHGWLPEYRLPEKFTTFKENGDLEFGSNKSAKKAPCKSQVKFVSHSSFLTLQAVHSSYQKNPLKITLQHWFWLQSIKFGCWFSNDKTIG